MVTGVAMRSGCSCRASALHEADLKVCSYKDRRSRQLGPPCRCRIRMLSCVLLHSNNAGTRGKGEPDGTMRRLRQGHSLRPQHPAQARGAVGTQGPEDEPHLQGERAEEDVRYRRSVATAERLHALPAHAAQGHGVALRRGWPQASERQSTPGDKGVRAPWLRRGENKG